MVEGAGVGMESSHHGYEDQPRGIERAIQSAVQHATGRSGGSIGYGSAKTYLGSVTGFRAAISKL